MGRIPRQVVVAVVVSTMGGGRLRPALVEGALL
jgi:hypothetical protein